MTPDDLRKARKALGLSQSGLATALTDPDHLAVQSRAVTDRTIRRWEAGTQDIPHPAVVAIKLLLRQDGDC